MKRRSNTSTPNPSTLQHSNTPALHLSNLPISMIKFGTSGWRGLIARDFTFDNVRVATQGIADFLQSEFRNPKSEIAGREPVVILGHDTRFLGHDFALAAAEVLAADGIV